MEIRATTLDPKVGSTFFSQQKVVMSRPLVKDGLIRLSANIPGQVGETVQLEWSINHPKIKETGVMTKPLLVQQSIIIRGGVDEPNQRTLPRI